MPKNLSNNLKISCFCDEPDPKVLIKGKKFDIVKCRNCKLIYADTILSKKEIDKLYDIDDSYLRINESLIERDDCLRRLCVIRKCFPTGRKNNTIRILDFGTGMSNFTYLAKEQGFDSYGYDIDQKIVRFHEKNRMKMVRLDSLKDNHFDVITMFHVLEHVDTPVKLLAFLRRKLCKNGIIYIDVPNGESLEIKLFGEKSPYLSTSDKSHLYYYSLRTLPKMLEALGLKVIRKRHKGVFAIGLISGFKKKVTGSKDVGVAYEKGRFIAKLYRKTCEILRISDCIEVIARK